MVGQVGWVHVIAAVEDDGDHDEKGEDDNLEDQPADQDLPAGLAQ